MFPFTALLTAQSEPREQQQWVTTFSVRLEKKERSLVTEVGLGG